MALSVRILSTEMVRPSEPTPTGPLNLSVIDRVPLLRFNLRMLLVFKDGDETSVKSIREALSKALVPYYPLAGRLKQSSSSDVDDVDDDDDQDLRVFCTGEGAWFVEASADCTLDNVNYLDGSTFATHRILLPDSIPPADYQIAKGLQPILQMQEAPKIPAVPPPPLMPSYHIKPTSLDIAAHKLDHLKRELSNSIGKTCSTFEVLTASIWRSRTRAIINLNHSSSINVKLVFYAGASHILNPPPPQGFYGNCIFPITVSVSSEWLVEASLGEVVRVIKEAKRRLPSDFNKWIVHDHSKGDVDGDGGGDPFVVPMDYTTLCISDWTRLGVKDMDFGRGCPVHVVSAEVPEEIMSLQPFVLPCLPPKPKTGIRLAIWCVEESHLPSFLDQMNNLMESTSS
ncbi:hypothetical protein Syun_008202 [Stephania yunnanensis]|uniref:Uncharacterized protein n=1 Tax=Stephania yunnanensis TaxID=152371 RepID=A0AAP0Q362_9MAGN